MNVPNKTSQLQSLGDERRNFLQAASALSIGSAISVLSPLASAQTTDSFVLVTVQLNLKPGKVEPLSKEVLENALKETRRFEGLISLELYSEQGSDTVLNRPGYRGGQLV
jgi:hypothetical protein